MGGDGRMICHRQRKGRVRSKEFVLPQPWSQYRLHPLAGRSEARVRETKRTDAKGKGRAMSPISLESSGDRSSEEEEASFSSRGRSKENDNLSSEEEVCLFHDLIRVLTFI